MYFTLVKSSCLLFPNSNQLGCLGRLQALEVAQLILSTCQRLEKLGLDATSSAPAPGAAGMSEYQREVQPLQVRRAVARRTLRAAALLDLQIISRPVFLA